MISLALALLTGRCRYGVEAGGVDLSLFPQDATFVTLPKEMRGIVPTNGEAARSIQAGHAGRNLRFVIIGDTVSDRNTTFQGFLREIAALDPPPAFIVHLGDRAVSPVGKYFGAYLKVIEDPPCPILHVDGNHDVREEGERLARAFFGDRDFYFDLDDKRFVFMGNARPQGAQGFSREQLHWLEGALSSPSPARKFFFAHAPPRAPFKRIFPGLASLLTPALENEKEFLDILTRHHVVLAAFGHRHIHASRVYNNVLMVITGGGGQGNFWYPNVKEPLFTKKNHYMLVDIPGSGLGEPLRGVLACIGKHYEKLFISSFSQPGFLSGDPELTVALRPCPASDLVLFRPGDPTSAGLAVSGHRR